MRRAVAEPVTAALERPSSKTAECEDVRSGSGYGGRYRADVDETAVIRHYMPLIKRTALHLKGRLPESVQPDDLIQAGSIAVLRIIRRGDPVDSVTSRQALQRSIRNAMIDEARREVWAPVRTLRLAKAASAAMRAVRQRRGRDGDDQEVAAEMGLGVAEYHAALVEIAGIRLLQIDEVDEADDRIQIAETQDKGLDRARAMGLLARAIAALPEREKLVMSLYYERELNMDEVGKVLGIDKATVSRAHGRALLILRSALNAAPTVELLTNNGRARRGSGV